MTKPHFWVWGVGLAPLNDKKVPCFFLMSCLESTSTGLRENNIFSVEKMCNK